MFALCLCWYEGDSYLVDNSLIAVSMSVEDLLHYLSNSYRDYDKVYLPNEDVPDDGGYGDKRRRYRIVSLEKIMNTYVLKE